jgi:hypothetical protein
MNVLIIVQLCLAKWVVFYALDDNEFVYRGTIEQDKFVEPVEIPQSIWTSNASHYQIKIKDNEIEQTKSIPLVILFY